MATRLRDAAQSLLRSMTLSQSIEEQQIAMMTSRMREMSSLNLSTSRKLVMCEYHDRPPGDSGYAEGKIELADGTRHPCTGSIIKGALNGFCVITITTPNDETPIEVSAIFTLGYAVGITYFHWPDGLLMQVSLDDSVLVSSGPDRFIFASFPADDSPTFSSVEATDALLPRPTKHEFVVFLEPPSNQAFTKAAGQKSPDFSHSCQFAQILKSYAISCLQTFSNGKIDKGVVIIPEECPSSIDVVRKLIVEMKFAPQPLKESMSRKPIDFSQSHTGASATVTAAPAPLSSVLPSNTEDLDFSLFCMILMELESWQPQTRKREDSKLDAPSPNAVNEQNEVWTLFDYKMSDPSGLIVHKLQRGRSGTNAYSGAAPAAVVDDSSTMDGGAPQQSSLSPQFLKPKEGTAVNLRCMPLFLRAMSTFQDKHVMAQKVVLKGSGYRILIKAARSIKERQEGATSLLEKNAAIKYRNETLPVLLRLLPHVLHQVQDENWSSFSMSLEFAWWLSELAPVQLNMSGLHVLSCACVLGCR
jgi:hypothetical protein